MTEKIETSVSKVENNEAELDYRTYFMPSVHKIGRLTMIAALILSFAPIIWFVVVDGYSLPFSTYVSGILSVSSIGIGMWLSEPEAYWPVLGSAGTYIAYLSGNVGGMRFPVATTVQKNMNADITTPRGQVVTIVGIVASVVANLIILLIIVLGGNWILNHLPAAVIGSFAFVVISMLGAMLCMNLQGRDKSARIANVIIYMGIGIGMWFVCNRVFPNMFGWGMAFAVGLSILYGYSVYRRDLANAEKK